MGNKLKYNNLHKFLNDWHAVFFAVFLHVNTDLQKDVFRRCFKTFFA